MRERKMAICEKVKVNSHSHVGIPVLLRCVQTVPASDRYKRLVASDSHPCTAYAPACVPTHTSKSPHQGCICMLVFCVRDCLQMYNGSFVAKGMLQRHQQ